MSYRTASSREISCSGYGSDKVYARHGVDVAMVSMYRQSGVPASVAKVFQAGGGGVSSSTAWLASTFSTFGLRQLARHPLSATDVVTLHVLADLNVSTLRAYVSKTRLQVSEIEWLMSRGLPCEVVVLWTSRLLARFEAMNVTDVLKQAVLLYQVPDGDVAGWVRYTNKHGVVYDNSGPGWSFLGGHTGLMAMAGLSPSEADTMTDEATLDLDGLRMLSALRAVRT